MRKHPLLKRCLSLQHRPLSERSLSVVVLIYRYPLSTFSYSISFVSSYPTLPVGLHMTETLRLPRHYGFFVGDYCIEVVRQTAAAMATIEAIEPCQFNIVITKLAAAASNGLLAVASPINNNTQGNPLSNH